MFCLFLLVAEHSAQAGQCTGQQIEKMLAAGFEKSEILQLCGTTGIGSSVPSQNLPNTKTQQTAMPKKLTFLQGMWDVEAVSQDGNVSHETWQVDVKSNYIQVLASYLDSRGVPRQTSYLIRKYDFKPPHLNLEFKKYPPDFQETDVLFKLQTKSSEHMEGTETAFDLGTYKYLKRARRTFLESCAMANMYPCEPIPPDLKNVTILRVDGFPLSKQAFLNKASLSNLTETS